MPQPDPSAKLVCSRHVRLKPRDGTKESDFCYRVWLHSGTDNESGSRQRAVCYVENERQGTFKYIPGWDEMSMLGHALLYIDSELCSQQPISEVWVGEDRFDGTKSAFYSNHLRNVSDLANANGLN